MNVLYRNGDILTMEHGAYPEAVLTLDGRIAFVGSEEEARRLAPENVVDCDLAGKTLMPAFVDSHSHISAVANGTLQLNLETCQSADEVKKALSAYIEKNRIGPDEWILAFGYSGTLLKIDLDEVCKNPVFVSGKSKHFGIFSSCALHLLGIDSKDGYLEETALYEAEKQIPMPGYEKLKEAYRKAENEYFSYGICTIQDACVPQELFSFYNEAVKENLFCADIVVYADARDLNKAKEELAQIWQQYKNHVKMCGAKLFLDGSPQTKTAWMKEPYVGGGTGFRAMDDEALRAHLETCSRDNLQVIAHSNGDMAAKQFIDALLELKRMPPRPVVIHAQTISNAEIERIAGKDILLSFFVAHTYYFGDIHMKNLGAKRAGRISPCGTAERCGVRFTLHQDAPVIRPDMFETIYCAAARKTKDGAALSEKERISVYDALLAVTKNAAYQCFEENDKGSIREGKKADLIIVSQNPLKIQRECVKDILVLETIKDGKTVFKRDQKI